MKKQLKNDEDLKREKLVKKLRKEYKLDDMTDEKRSALIFAANQVYYDRKKKADDEELAELKKKYEGKYFQLKNKDLCYIQSMMNKFQCFGWILEKNPPKDIERNSNEVYHFVEGYIGDIVSEPHAMAGSKLKDARIKGAKELTREQALTKLRDKFDEIQELAGLKK